MDIVLEKERGITKHSFFCKLESKTNKVKILNADQSPYQKGWHQYAPFESFDGRRWQRTRPGIYDGKAFSFNVSKGVKYACWFPPYDMKRMEKICAAFQKIGKSGFFLGNQNKKTIVLMAGQHPGETMGIYFLEGILKHLDPKNNFSFLIFPYMNKDGIREKNHRLTPDGIDLNRDWKNPNNALLQDIKKQIEAVPNLYAVIDIHGDEVSQKDYVIYNKYFQNSFLKKCCQASGFSLVKRSSAFKKFIKNLIRQHKIVWLKGQAARDFFEKKGVLAITVELSAANNTPESCIQKGAQFFQK